MRSVLVFAIYVLKNWKLSATPPKWLRDPLGVATHRLGTAALGDPKKTGLLRLLNAFNEYY